MTTRHLARLWPGRRGGTGRDRRWARLARTLADIGFWHGVPLAQLREQYRAVAAGGYNAPWYEATVRPLAVRE